MISTASKFGTADAVLLVVVVLLLAISSVLALAETSLVRTSRAKALALEDDHHRGASQLVRLVRAPRGVLERRPFDGARLPTCDGDPGRAARRTLVRQLGRLRRTRLRDRRHLRPRRGDTEELRGPQSRTLGSLLRAFRLGGRALLAREDAFRTGSSGSREDRQAGAPWQVRR